jgi:predicted nucleic acid-binding protein
MIALDTRALIAYLSGAASGPSVQAVDVALSEGQACLPPVVLTELLSDPTLSDDVGDLFRQLPLLDLTAGYWERAGRLRARVLAARHRARVADALIAQSCLDHDVPLVTLDADFRRFAAVSRLKVVP